MRICQGLIEDIKNRYPYYRTDFYGIGNSKVISASFYLFFACLANAVAFGSLSSLLTGGEIGVIEMIIATAVGGIFYAFFSAQPITLLGGTGPIVIFTSLLFAVCQKYEIEFLSAYSWCGIWAGSIMIIFSIFNISNLMGYFSRFTDDIFAALVSIIFIVEAMKNLFKNYSLENWTNQNVWVSVLLALGTCALITAFCAPNKYMKGSANWAKVLSDFAPTISIVLMAFVAFVIPNIVLQVPDISAGYEAALFERKWFVDLNGISGSLKIAMFIPAAFAAILLFLDQNITSHIINETGAELRKGHGYHLDLILVGIMVIAFSLIGLPWIVAATVHSVNHLKSLTIENKNNNNDSIVIETRISALIIHICIAASLVLLSWVELIPMAVLFGLFIFMGLVSLRGNQFFLRSLALLIPFSNKISSKINSDVSKRGRAIFTLIQITCFSLLWFIKSSFLGILFPIFIATCVPVRIFISRFVNKNDLKKLDNLEKLEK